MSAKRVGEWRRLFEDEQRRLAQGGYGSTPEDVPTDAVAAAAYWREQCEHERVRLGKLWILYTDLQHENEILARKLAAKPAATAPSAPARNVVVAQTTTFDDGGEGSNARRRASVATRGGYRPQCGGITVDGVQCSNPARRGSRYCIAHRNYHPRTLKGIRRTSSVARRKGIRATDIEPRFQKTPDTAPTIRRS